MSGEDGRSFLSRWSRRKIEARAAEHAAAEDKPAVPDAPVPGAADAAAAPVPASKKAQAQEGEPLPELPDPETLRGLESDYRQFLRPEVDESLRRTALKKLFADPHFNVMDGLDVYIDDYSKPDPIPAALLRTMNQARGLRLFDDDPDADTAAAPAETPAEGDVATQQTIPEPDGGAPGAGDDNVANVTTDCPAGVEASSSPPGPQSLPGKTG